MPRFGGVPALLVALPILALVRLLDSVLPLFRLLTLLARRTVLPHTHQEPFLSTEDLEDAVNVSDLSAEMIRQEKEILHNILDLSEIRVEEVMRPRGSYPAFAAPIRAANLGGKIPAGDYVAVLRPAATTWKGRSRFRAFRSSPPTIWKRRRPTWCTSPGARTLAMCLTLLREQVADVASVVNEYGETIGIVTYDDLLDAVLIPEPARMVRFLAREPVLEVAPGCYHAEGITPLRHLSSRLGMEYEPESDELVTLAGLLHEKLEHMPAVGDECTWRGFRVRVIEVSKRGRLRAMLSKEPAATETST